jgi:threonine aldolase
VGVDVLCFGGTKNGMSGGEAVIFFNRSLSEEFAYRCKQAGQLASKMRFLSAQWVGLLQNDAWIHHATRANAMASLLRQRLSSVPGTRLLYPTQANAVFAELAPELSQRLHAAGWELYRFIGGGTRFMCSWDTTEADIDDLLRDLLQ